MPRVRLATEKDLDVLVRHRRKMFEEISDASAAQLDAVDRRYRRWARTRLRSGHYVAFLVETRGGLIPASGGLWLMPLPPRPRWGGDRAPYVMSMYTEPEDRGRGYATLVVRSAVRWARARGYKVMVLHSSDEGKAIYERAGFRPTSEMRLRFDRVEHTGKGRGRPSRRAPRTRR